MKVIKDTVLNICVLPGNDLELDYICYNPVFTRDGEIYCITKFGVYILASNKFKLCSSFNLDNYFQYCEFCNVQFIITNKSIINLDKDLFLRQGCLMKYHQVAQIFNHLIIYSGIDSAQYQVYDILSGKFSDIESNVTSVNQYKEQLQVQGIELQNYLKEFIATKLNCYQFVQISNKYKRTKSQLKSCQLMNVVKLLPTKYFYLVIEDNFMYVVDQEQYIYGRFPIDFDFYAGKVDLNINGNSPSVANHFLYQSTIFKGEIYVLNNHKLYQVNKTQLKYIMEIKSKQEMKESNKFLSGLATFNNQLYINFNFEYIYQIDLANRTIHETKLTGFPLSFCEKLYLLDYDRIHQITDNLEMAETLFTIPQSEMPRCFSGGVLLAPQYSESQEIQDSCNIICADLINERLIQKQLKFAENYSLQSQLGESGLQINKELASVIFDNQYGQQAQKHFATYVNDIVDRFPSYLEQANCLISNAHYQSVSNAFQQHSEFCQILSTSIHSKFELVASQINIQRDKVQTMIQMFDQLNSMCDQ
ncbi:Conserved_hypothetical protein [Hexamita inflata]|uniref:Uncharacterized protein n=1 Tax=Hexamita inflata TaxID=28002 RepID=A0AA86PBJ5_9EUKA|nr:Conserved hypothetical protein [Hexamita inflata]